MSNVAIAIARARRTISKATRRAGLGAGLTVTGMRRAIEAFGCAIGAKFEGNREPIRPRVRDASQAIGNLASQRRSGDRPYNRDTKSVAGGSPSC